jgi:squalene-associated FAD-dependent desaturase
MEETANARARLSDALGVAMSDPRPHALIIGGGLAGLAAATALAPRGWRVSILESRQRLGGRASSFPDPATGQLVDACQHVSMGCCVNFAHFCQTIGIDSWLKPQPVLYFQTPDRRVSRFQADRLPAPLHLARAFLSSHYLSPGEKYRIGSAIASLKQSDPDADPPLLDWLRRHRQTPRCIGRFWSVILVSALNESIDRLGLRYARKVIVDGFLTHRLGFEVQIPSVPLGEFYGDRLASWFERFGSTIELGQGVSRVDVAGNQVQGVVLRDGRALTADAYLVATPFERLLDLLPAETITDHACFSNLEKLDHSPITSVHFWLDRSILALPHVVLVDCLGHWLFNRGETNSGEHYVQVVISCSRELKKLGREEIERRVLAELGELFPIARTARVARSKVVTEHAATFSAVPGIDRWRPMQETPVERLFLAGDYTRTGWPATMEGAVRSGYLAAEAIFRRHGQNHRMIQPDL